MMSVAEIVSMAMAKLLVVVFEGDRMTWQDVDDPKIIKKNLYRHVSDDGHHVDQVSPC